MASDLALSVSAEQFVRPGNASIRPGLSTWGRTRVKDRLYFRDPNGVGLELYREELGH